MVYTVYFFVVIPFFSSFPHFPLLPTSTQSPPLLPTGLCHTVWVYRLCIYVLWLIPLPSFIHASSLWIFFLIPAHGGTSKCKSKPSLNMIVKICRVKATNVNFLDYLSGYLFRYCLLLFLPTLLYSLLVFLAFNCCLKIVIVSLTGFFGMGSQLYCISFLSLLCGITTMVYSTPSSQSLAPTYPSQENIVLSVWLFFINEKSYISD